MSKISLPAVRGVLLAAAVVAATPVFADAAITAVPPAAYRAPATPKSAVAAMLLPSLPWHAPHTAALAAPAAASPIILSSPLASAPCAITANPTENNALLRIFFIG